MFRTRFALAFALLLLCAPAHAATCFWVGGTGNATNSNTASWSSSSGGTASTCAATGGIPKQAGDIATFDGSSGGGTITVCGASTTTCPSGTGNWTLGELVAGAFTGTLDFSAINPSVTSTLASGTAFSFSGSGTRTINMGNGTWTVAACGGGTNFDITTQTGLTLNANSSTVLFSGGTNCGQLFNFNTRAMSTVTFGSRTGTGKIEDLSGAHTYATFNISAPNYVQLDSGTITVTNPMVITATPSSPVFINSGVVNTATTISSAAASTCTWCSFKDITFTGGGSFTATNSTDFGNNTGLTITPPSAGGGGGIISGWLLWRDIMGHANDNSPAWLEKAA